MEWIVENYEDYKNRNKEIVRIIIEKQKQVKQLQFEIACNYYLLTTLKNIGWDNKEK